MDADLGEWFLARLEDKVAEIQALLPQDADDPRESTLDATEGFEPWALFGTMFFSALCPGEGAAMDWSKYGEENRRLTIDEAMRRSPIGVDTWRGSFEPHQEE